VGTLAAVNKLKREIEFAFACGFINHTFEFAPVSSDPAAAVKARTKISADAEFAGDLKQRLLDP
jgi:hypothetical protein